MQTTRSKGSLTATASGAATTGDQGSAKKQADMTPEEQVAFAWKHRDHFAKVSHHNMQVTINRYRGGDWSLPENQYRNAYAELGA